MNSKPPPTYLTKVNHQVPQGTLEKIRDRVAEARDITFEIADLNARIKALNARYTELTRIILPEMLSAAKVPTLTIDATGNQPKMLAKREPYYYANIAADWDDDRKQEAFRYLESKKAGDLIKAKITAILGRDSRADQKQIIKFLDKLKRVEYSSGISVPWNTLTSWLKAEVEANRIPKLDLIGGDIGQIVKLKEVKDE
jgi:hypothetical protein